MTNINKKHNGTISLLKFLFSILIILFHIGSWHPEVLNRFPLGCIGVEFFFIVSGFLFCKKIINEDNDNKSLGDSTFCYFIKLIKKFLPFLLFFLVITIPYIFFIKKYSLSYLVDILFVFLYIPKNIHNDITINSIYGISWYLIVLVVSETILYSFIKKYKKNFVYIVSPIIILLLSNYLLIHYGNFLSPWAQDYFCFKGVLRGFLEINIGIYLYAISNKIKNIKLTNLSSFLITIIEIFCYALVFYISNEELYYSYDFFMTIALSIGILISFSTKSLIYDFCNNKFFYYLEKLSLPMYLNQCLIINIVRYIIDILKFKIPFIYESLIILIIIILLAIIELKIIEVFNKKSKEIRLIFIK